MSQSVGRVLVMGATGSIGRLVVARLLALGDQPRALTRDVERARRVLDAGVDISAGDLTDPASVRAALNGIAAVVLTHGASYGSGDYEAVDYGAVPAVLGALDGRPVRVALMSSIGVTGTGGSSRELLDWKRRGERLLRSSGLPYTIVRPGWFDAGSGQEARADLRQGDGTQYGPVRREHVAEVLVQAIRTKSALARTVEVFSSDGAPISDWATAFATAEPDVPDALDGARDRPGPPLEREPERLQADVRRWGQPSNEIGDSATV
jgi:uncharacterized protein YbjT (DUF2867 family)